MLQFSRIPNAMYSSSQHFQLVYLWPVATFSKARHAVIYSVGSLDVLQTYKACRSLRSWASKNVVRTCSSCTSMIRFRCLDKYVSTKFLADLDLLSDALALQMARGLRGAQPPPVEKHGQRSEHIDFLTVHRLFCFESCLHYEIAGGLGGAQTPPICKNMDEDQNTYIFLHPSDGCVLQCVLRCCDVFDLQENCHLQYVYSSKRRKYSNLKRSFVAF